MSEDLFGYAESGSPDWKQSLHTPLEVAVSKIDGFAIEAEQLKLYDRVIWALGPTEPRSALLLHGHSPQPETARQIYNRAKQALAPDTWFPSEISFRKTHLSAMQQVGLISRKGYGYATTNLGETIAKPIAALLLYYSATHPFPVSLILGKTNSKSESRSHINRSAILLSLSQQPSFEIELARELETNKGTIKSNLFALRDLGLITHDSVDTEVSGWGIYKKVGGSGLVQHSATLNRVRQNVVKYFELNPTGNIYAILEALERSDSSDVQAVLSEMVTLGFLEQEKWQAAVKQSDTAISRDGQDFVETVLKPILLVSRGDTATLQMLQTLQAEVESNATLTSQAISNYRRHHQRRPYDDTRQQIFDLLSQGPTRYQEVIAVAGSTADHILRELVAQGTLVKIRDGKAVFYSRPNSPIPPVGKKRIEIQFTTPTELLPPTCYPKEYYRDQLETPEFWQELLSDLTQNSARQITERDFFSFYRPDNPNWQERNDYTSGKYNNHIIALRKLGVKNPYRHLREYQPQSDDLELCQLVEATQTEIINRLTATPDKKYWRDYLEDLHTEEFWTQMTQTLDRVTGKLGSTQFLTDFTVANHTELVEFGGDFFNLYNTLRNHTDHAPTFLRTFTPTLPHVPGLSQLIKRVQQQMEDKLIFRRPRIQPQEWVATLDSQDFWVELERDLDFYQGGVTFWTFLYHFDENNNQVEMKLQENGSPYLGKYYQIINACRRHLELFLDTSQIANLPESISNSLAKNIRRIVFHKAPQAVKDLLLLKFPTDFSFTFDAPGYKGGLQSLFPEDVTLKEISFAAQALPESEPWILSAAFTQEELVTILEAPDIPRAYIEKIAAHPILSVREQKELARLIERGKLADQRLAESETKGYAEPYIEQLRVTVQQGLLARDEIIRTSQRLVLKLAHRFSSHQTPFVDLVQAGNIGLLKAIAFYDWRTGYAFSTIATRAIRWEMLAELGGSSGFRRGVSNQIAKMVKAEEILMQQGIALSADNISQATGMLPETIKNLQRVRQGTASLNAPLGEDDDTLEDIVVDFSSFDPETQTFQNILRQTIDKCLKSDVISSRQADMIRLRYGLIDGEPKTLEQVGQIHDLTKERIRQLVEDAFEEIRNSSYGEDLREFL